MRKCFFWVCGLLAVLTCHPAGAQTNAAAPDFSLAYVLAAASYCAYAVGAIDSDGDKVADHGRKRAFDCLMAAVETDPSRLAALNVEVADVEAYFSPSKPQNAYLLIRAKTGVILAFRGTLTLPISPGKASLNGLVKEAIETFNGDVLKAFESYLRDWGNNIIAFADEKNRHAGFDRSWQELKEHLKIACEPGAAADCSQFRSFMSAVPGQQLFLTGHSKGGALATLASLDMAEFFERAPETTTYTFAAPKSLSGEGAKNAAEATADLWRFEEERDVVPSLPLDKTAFPITIEAPLTDWKMAPYAHVGGLVSFGQDGKPRIYPDPADGSGPPGDLNRLKAILWGGAERAADRSGEEKGLLDRVLSAGADGCRRFVDVHFSVFSSVQNAAWAGGGGKDFFLTGLSNPDGEILWGYGQWCRMWFPVK